MKNWGFKVPFEEARQQVVYEEARLLRSQRAVEWAVDAYWHCLLPVSLSPDSSLCQSTWFPVVLRHCMMTEVPRPE